MSRRRRFTSPRDSGSAICNIKFLTYVTIVFTLSLSFLLQEQYFSSLLYSFSTILFSLRLLECYGCYCLRTYTVSWVGVLFFIITRAVYRKLCWTCTAQSPYLSLFRGLCNFFVGGSDCTHKVCAATLIYVTVCMPTSVAYNACYQVPEWRSGWTARKCYGKFSFSHIEIVDLFRPQTVEVPHHPLRLGVRNRAMRHGCEEARPLSSSQIWTSKDPAVTQVFTSLHTIREVSLREPIRRFTVGGGRSRIINIITFSCFKAVSLNKADLGLKILSAADVYAFNIFTHYLQVSEIENNIAGRFLRWSFVADPTATGHFQDHPNDERKPKVVATVSGTVTKLER